MAKIAVTSAPAPRGQRSHVGGSLTSRLLAAGNGWLVEDVVCTCGPHDRRYEEQHSLVTIAIVTSGTFQYRGSGCNGREMMTPGSLLLGSPGQCFECGHEHAVGDRCLSFRFTPEYFDTVSGMTEACSDKRTFGSLRLPPLRTLSSVVADACVALAGSNDRGWQELGIRLAAGALQADRDPDSDLRPISAATLARLTRSVRMIEACPDAELTVVDLAREARLSPFHFVRVFERVTGATPHQFVSRARLRAAATRLRTSGARIVDIAFDAGFNDLSTFNRAFRTEFGASPRVYRRNRGDMPSASIR